MVVRTFRASWLIIATLLLASTAACTCMGVGELLERDSQSQHAQHSMCGGMKMHGPGGRPATSQPTGPVANGAATVGRGHELHHDTD